MNKSRHSSQATPTHRPIQIGSWLVDPDAARVVKNGRSVKLEPKVMGLLIYLAQRPGQVLARSELEQAIWTGTVVGYDALTSAIIKLRKAFGDDAHQPWLIETVAKRGYRLIAPVSEVGRASPSLASGPNTIVRNWRTLAAALMIVALTGALGIWFAFDYFGPRPIRVPSVAVLPFTNLGNDPRLAYFSDGVREDIITDLSRLPGLRVIAANQALAAQDTAEAQGARFILEGSVRRAGDDIRITAKLIDAQTGLHLWTEGYNRWLRDIFAVQDDVTRNIVTALALTLTDEEKEYIARRDTRSVEAYDLFLQGQARYARNRRDDNAGAHDYFSRALVIDENFTRAHGALALTHVDDFRFSWSRDPAASAAAALRHAERAVALDSRSPQAHWVLGYVQLHVRRDHAAALKLGARATILGPNHADSHALLAVTQLYAGDTQAAVRHIERAIQLSPIQSSRYRSVLGFAHYFAGRYDKARAVLEMALEQNPSRLLPQLYLVATLNQLGKPDEARWLADNIHNEHPEFKLQDWAETQPFANQARRRKIVDDLRRAGFN